MPIRGMLSRGAFSSQEISEMVAAFDATLAALNLTDRTDPVTTLVAKVIIDCAKTGAIDRDRLRDCALEAVTKR